MEQARDFVEMAISRLRSQKGYFDFGNLGDGYFTMPDNWTPDVILAFEMKWNAAMDGMDVGMKRRNQFVPSGTEWHPTKVDILADEFDELLIRLLCFPFGVAPDPFMKKAGLGKGSSETEHDAAEEGGVAPLMGYVERLMNLIIAKWFDRADLEFAFVEDREFDPKTAAEIDDLRLANRTRTINEVRDRNGEQSVPWGDEPLVDGGAAVIPLSLALERGAKEPEPAPAALQPASPGAADAVAEPAAPADDAALTKAADTGLQIRLSIIVNAYLAAKAKFIAAALADDLTADVAKAVNPTDDYSGRIDQAYSTYDWDWSDMPPIVEPTLVGIAVAAGSDAVSQLGLFDKSLLQRVSARSTAYAEARAAELVGMKWIDGVLVPNPDAAWSITETTRTMLRSAIRDAMAEGQSNDQLRKTIQQSSAFSKDRADMIARTETAVADVQGAAVAWIESGVVTSARFDASPGCCDECQADDGTIVDLASPDDLELPHPNCRCSWSAVVDEEPA